MAQLTYNGVTLPAVNITRFEQRALEDDSHTDWYCTEFDFTVHSIINTQYITITVGGVILTNPADIMSTLRTLLLARRKPISLKFNGVELMPKIQTGNLGTVDSQNGPKPVNCQLIQLTNTTFLLNYQIKATFWENNTVGPYASRNNQVGNPVLYNRWSETVDIDILGQTKRTRQGKVLIRSDNTQGFIADQVRVQMAAVSIPPNFLRESANYTVDPSGLAMQYRVTDQEVYKMPPKPAFKAEGEYTETAPNFGQPMRFGKVRVKLYGDNATTNGQVLLAQTALDVAMGKLWSNISVNYSPGFMLNDASMRVGMYENWVEVNLGCLYAQDNKRVATTLAFQGGAQATEVTAFFGSMGVKPVNGIGAGLTYTPYTDDLFARGYVPSYSERGSAGLLLQAAAYYDPSISLDGNSLVTNAASTPKVAAAFGIDLSDTVGGSQLNRGLQPGQAGKRKET